MAKVIPIAGDITEQTVDAIVNAANSSLMGGGGVDGAIHSKGGPSILEECKAIRSHYPEGLPTGEAVITGAGRLPASYVIHTVGPIYGSHGGEEASLLTSCYENCLKLAVEYSLVTVAFPAISTGVYGYPKDEAAKISSNTISGFLETNSSIEEVRLVFFSQRDLDIFLDTVNIK